MYLVQSSIGTFSTFRHCNVWANVTRKRFLCSVDLFFSKFLQKFVAFRARLSLGFKGEGNQNIASMNYINILSSSKFRHPALLFQVRMNRLGARASTTVTSHTTERALC